FVTTPPASKRASVSEWIGLSQVKIDYSRPAVNGREGTIYGAQGLVPYNNGNPFPWRAGANENTVITLEADAKINGQALPAGAYGFHIIPAEEEWILIFSSNNHSWGSFNYDSTEDVLRVSVKPETCDHEEWLRFEFVNATNNSTDIQMSWESKKISFTVEMDVHALTMNNIEKELDNLLGFGWQGWNSAAQYTLASGKDLEKGLEWARRAYSPGFFGTQKNFTTLQTESQILTQLGKAEAAKAIMDQAIPLATMTELHFYGRTLIQQNKPKEAMAIFQMNRDNNPDDNFTTLVGLARGNMANENFKEAAKYFRIAAKNAPAGQAPAYENLAKQCEDRL
ncbi:MAG: DUF2911 domain-containing protein, partial [Bacteroidetes bacterium]